ncbi:putative ubx domain containing protein [Schistosoma mansoni]|uniref:NSFL1 cofactor p47 n=1 Tax=Schistosoma mansoni TaxID=6183 RepID=G4VAK6_SCHMA|nr:putative ubx domain containing protein [Schistosoma mansoni]|eukprot:XP_018648357.1 putative ubx domain containing protein [Schistosoma mansoni]
MDPSVIENFCSITGTSEIEARHFLEAFDWNCDEAVKAYFDSEDAVHSSDGSHFDQAIQPPSKSNNEPPLSTFNKPPYSKPKIATLSTLENDSDDESDKGQAFYVGGSETGGGGQQVLGPPRRGDNKKIHDPSQTPDVFIRNLFQAAKGKGAEVLDTHEYNEYKSKSKKQLPFSGTGYKLGDDLNAPPQLEATTASGSSTNNVSEKNVVVKMWRDGFSLDSGPLRSYTDPDASEFLNAIQNGQIPEELLKSAGGSMVNVMLEDHHHEEWKAPSAPKIKPFSGVGHMLGSPLPHVVSNAPTKVNVNEKHEPGVTVDDTKPVTQIQIRLPDGSRFVVRLNNFHTIGDIRRAIVSERPDLASRLFALMTSYPTRELNEDTQTLEDGDLLNSSLIVRFI